MTASPVPPTLSRLNNAGLNPNPTENPFTALVLKFQNPPSPVFVKTPRLILFL